MKTTCELATYSDILQNFITPELKKMQDDMWEITCKMEEERRCYMDVLTMITLQDALPKYSDEILDAWANFEESKKITGILKRIKSSFRSEWYASFDGSIEIIDRDKITYYFDRNPIVTILYKPINNSINNSIYK